MIGSGLVTPFRNACGTPLLATLPAGRPNALALVSNKKTPPFHVERGCSSQYLLVLGVLGARLGNIDLELVVSHGIVIEHADCLIGIRLRWHSYKSEAFRHASRLIFDEINRGDGSGLCEQSIDFILRGRLVQVSYVNSNIHFVTTFYPKGHVSGRAGNKMTANPIRGSAAKRTTEIQLLLLI